MVDRVLKRRLGINEPTVGLGATTLFEEGEGADERLKVNLKKLLKVSRCGDVMLCIVVVAVVMTSYHVVALS